MNVLEFHAPPRQNAGVVHFYVSFKSHDQSIIQYSNAVPFYYQPIDDTRSTLFFIYFYFILFLIYCLFILFYLFFCFICLF